MRKSDFGLPFEILERLEAVKNITAALKLEGEADSETPPRWFEGVKVAANLAEQVVRVGGIPDGTSLNVLFKDPGILDGFQSFWAAFHAAVTET